MKPLVNVPLRNRDGQEFVLIADEVSVESAFPDALTIVPPTVTCSPIHVPEEVVATARATHPGLPVYGIWQALIHSGIVKPDGQPVYFFYTDREQESGVLLSLQDGYIKETVPFIAGFPPGFPVAGRHEITREDIDRIKLPDEPILLPAERAAIRRRRLGVLGAVTAAVCAGIIAVAVLLDIALAIASKRAVEEAARINAQADVVQLDVNDLKATRDPITLEERARVNTTLSRVSEVLGETAWLTLAPFDVREPTTVLVSVAAIPVTLSMPIVMENAPASVPQIAFHSDGTDMPSGLGGW